MKKIHSDKNQEKLNIPPSPEETERERKYNELYNLMFNNEELNRREAKKKYWKNKNRENDTK